MRSKAEVRRGYSCDNLVRDCSGADVAGMSSASSPLLSDLHASRTRSAPRDARDPLPMRRLLPRQRDLREIAMAKLALRWRFEYDRIAPRTVRRVPHFVSALPPPPFRFPPPPSLCVFLFFAFSSSRFCACRVRLNSNRHAALGHRSSPKVALNRGTSGTIGRAQALSRGGTSRA